jgi:hypothetical protein
LFEEFRLRRIDPDRVGHVEIGSLPYGAKVAATAITIVAKPPAFAAGFIYCSRWGCGDRIYLGGSKEPGMDNILVVILVAILLLLAARLVMRHYFPPDT